MSLLWVRPAHAETHFSPEERRVRDFVGGRTAISESAESLSVKLGLSRGRTRRLLERLVQEGVVNRRDFEDIQPIYYRYPGRQ